MSGFERGFLSKPAVRALLERWTAEEEEQRIRELNDELYRRWILAWFKDAESRGGEERAR